VRPCQTFRSDASLQRHEQYMVTELSCGFVRARRDSHSTESLLLLLFGAWLVPHGVGSFGPLFCFCLRDERLCRTFAGKWKNTSKEIGPRKILPGADSGEQVSYLMTVQPMRPLLWSDFPLIRPDTVSENTVYIYIYSSMMIDAAGSWNS
jgi:hypothetical protein